METENVSLIDKSRLVMDQIKKILTENGMKASIVEEVAELVEEYGWAWSDYNEWCNE
jgi:hypothetical protein